MNAPKPNSQVFKSARKLEAWAAEFVQTLKTGQVLILAGDVSAGKTTFSRGAALGLGYMQEVTSPTYTYMHQYQTPQGLLLHADAYRLDDARKLWQMGLGELLTDSRLALIEWGEPLLPELPDALLLRFEILPKGREVFILDPQ